jgi:hypothetical protein
MPIFAASGLLPRLGATPILSIRNDSISGESAAVGWGGGDGSELGVPGPAELAGEGAAWPNSAAGAPAASAARRTNAEISWNAPSGTPLGAAAPSSPPDENGAII